MASLTPVIATSLELDDAQGTEVTTKSNSSLRSSKIEEVNLSAPKAGNCNLTDEPIVHYPEDIVLGFSEIAVDSMAPPANLLNGIQGYVKRGGITAVMGPSGCGKTVLMKVLCGREPMLSVSGDMSINGEVCVAGRHHPKIGFVPQEDFLIGVLTVRETFTIAAQLRLDLPRHKIDTKVTELIENLGMSHVADNIIGTPLKRGLSGGEKRRVSVGIELVADPHCVCLDEPTSGLDSTAAYKVIQTVKEICVKGGGKTSVMLSIHQPNARIVSLFDNLLLLADGEMVFFGTPKQATMYFGSIGFPAPADQTSTDFFLHVTDKSFQGQTDSSNVKRLISKVTDRIEVLTENFAKQSLSGAKPPVPSFCRVLDEGIEQDFDFRSAYRRCTLYRLVREVVMASLTLNDGTGDEVRDSPYGTDMLTQYAVLVKRNFLVAQRDITLYYLQFFLLIFYGFLVGALFYQFPKTIGPRIGDGANAVTWLCLMASYTMVFKIYYIMEMKKLFRHERNNTFYSTLPYVLADMTVLSICVFLVCIPGLVGVCYYMMGWDSASVAYTILSLYLGAMTSEAIMNLLCQFTATTPAAIISGQGVLVLTCLFTAGSFIRWDEIPAYWNWFSEITFYTPMSRGLLIALFGEVTYVCETVTDGNTCTDTGTGLVYTCNPGSTTDYCSVDGTEVLRVSKSVTENDEWKELFVVFILHCVIRVLWYIFMRWQPERIVRRLLGLLSTDMKTMIRGYGVQIRAVRMNLASLEHQVKEMRREEQNKDDKIDAPNLIRHESIVPVADASDSGSFLIWKNLSLTLKGSGKVLVDNVEGIARPGRVLGIMGPSGAGKTTMLNALSSRAPYAEVHGYVSYNGRTLTKSDLDYVPQFDSLNPVFTVKETFMFTAELKSDVCSARDLKKKAMELMKILGLKTVEDVPISQLTGGARKRVCIGQGVIADPKILFLDEPTTGIDSNAAYAVVKYIKKIAVKTNVLIVMTIHQPSKALFDLLDDLLLLAKGGKTAFYGRREDAIPFFSALGFQSETGTNPSDFFLDIVSGAPRPEEPETSWKDLYESSPLRKQITVPKSSGKEEPSLKPSQYTKFKILFYRNLKYNVREPGLYLFRMVEMIVFALYIGTIYFDLGSNLDIIPELIGAMFFGVWVTCFAALSGTPIMVRDRFTMDTEYMNGSYSTTTYMLANFFAGVPFHVLTALMFHAISWYLVGFNSFAGGFFFSVLSSSAILMFLEGMCLTIVEAVKNAMLATTLSMIALGSLFCFPGFFIKVDDMPRSVFWMSYMLPTTYALNAQIDVTLSGRSFATTDSAGNYMEVSGTYIRVNSFDQEEDYEKWLDFIVLVAFVIVMRIILVMLMNFNYRKFNSQQSVGAPTGDKGGSVKGKGKGDVEMVEVQ